MSRAIDETARARVGPKIGPAVLGAALLNAEEQALVIVDADDRVLLVNRAAERLLAWSRDGIVGQSAWMAMRPPGQNGNSPHTLRELLETDDRCQLSRRLKTDLRRANGDVFGCELSVSVTGAAGQPLFVALLHEVHDERATERDLRASEERLELALAGTEAGLWDWDIRAGQLFISDRTARMLGYPPGEQTLGISTWRSHIHPDDKPRVLAALSAHLSGQASNYEAEYRMRARSGTWVWILERGKVVTRDERGAPVRAAGTQVDTTSRRMAADALFESEARAQAILDTVADGVVGIDERGTIVSFNGAAEKIFGHTADSVIGRNVSILMPPPISAQHASFLEAYFRTGVPKIIGQGREVVGLRADGSTFPLDLAVSEVQVGQRRLFTGIVRDITERRQADQELRRSHAAAEKALRVQRQTALELEAAMEQLEAASAEASAANRAKSEFLANMSHEIRTPMTAILGYAELLTSEDLSEAERREHVRTIQRNGEHLLTIINDILDLSKIEAGRMEVETRDCAPAEIVAEVAALLESRAAAQNIALRVVHQPPLPAVIRTDPTRLRQILVNLVGNAIKFTALGEVRLETRLDRRDGDAPQLQFDVIDTGIGISAEGAAKLFRPFSQSDESTSRKFGGTGLGLVICRRLARALGGEVELVRAVPGEGSHFRFTIATGPIDEAGLQHTFGPPTEAPSAAAADGVQLGGRILLAEDGPDNQRLIAYHLRKAGADVAVAANGRIALEQLRAADDAGAPFDIVLMDMQMPEMDGYDATRALRAAGDRRPVIALTAHAMSGDRERCLAAGCDDFASKPIQRATLLQCCAHWLSVAGMPSNGRTGDHVASELSV